MANLEKLIEEDLKKSLTERKKENVSVLRMLKSAVKNREIELRRKETENLNDEQVVEIIVAEVKKRQDSLAIYKQAGRKDLADKEEMEIEILKKYLPEQLSDEEIKKMIEEIIGNMGDVGIKDFGKVMGQLMPKLKGRASGEGVSQLVRQALNN